jgi:hypothetical protein
MKSNETVLDKCSLDIVLKEIARKFKIFIYTFNFMGKIYPILVPFSIFPLKCMVKNYFKNVLNDHLYFIMVAIFNFICLYQEIEYQKLFENNNEI